MGNIVNQYIAANYPKIETLTAEIAQLSTDIQNINTAIGTEQARVVAIKKEQNRILNQILELWNAYPFKNAYQGLSSDVNVVVKQLALGQIPFPASTIGQTIKSLSAQYIELENKKDLANNTIQKLMLQYSEKQTTLAAKRKMLDDFTTAYNKGLADAQNIENQTATQESINQVNEAQATNPEFLKIKAEADVAKAVADTEAKTKQKNTTIIVVVVGVVLIVAVIAWGLTRGK